MIVSSTLVQSIIPISSISLIIAILTLCFFRFKFHALRIKSSTSLSIAFFHPHCKGGGGGERVLWKAIESISQLSQEDHDKNVDGKMQQRKSQKFQIVVYTSDEKHVDYHAGTLPCQCLYL